MSVLPKISLAGRCVLVTGGTQDVVVGWIEDAPKPEGAP